MYWSLILIVILVRLMIILIEKIRQNSRSRRLRSVAGLFANNYVDSRAMYLARFGTIPSVGVITQLDSTAAFAFVKEHLAAQVVDVHQVNMYNYEAADTCFNITIFELNNNCLIEIGIGYAEVLYPSGQYGWAINLLRKLSDFRMEVEPVEQRAPTIIGFARAMEMN